MGTSGMGRFSDYGLDEETDKCNRIIENEFLENCGDYDYLKKELLSLEIGTRVKIDVQQRIVVNDLATGTSIGALSTSYEYIRSCIARGYQFDGEITSIDESNGLKEIKVTLIGTRKK